MVLLNYFDELTRRYPIGIKNLSLFEHVEQVSNSQSLVFLQGVVCSLAAEVLEHSVQLIVLINDLFAKFEIFLLGLVSD